MILQYLIAKTGDLSGGAMAIAALMLIALIVLIPIGVIWGINVLFDIGNPYDLTHWIAAMLMVIIFTPAPKSSRK